MALFTTSKRRFWRVLASAFLLFCTFAEGAPPETLRVEHLGDSTNFSISEVSSILEDQQGFIWFGSSNGLARYDGYEFKFYRNHVDDQNSISGSFVRGLLEDSDNNMWVITSEGLNLYNRELDNFERFYRSERENGTAHSNLSLCFMEDNNGRIWIGTHLGINLFDVRSRQFIDASPINDKIGDLHIISLYQDHRDDIWIGTKGLGLFQYESNTKQLKTHTHNPDDKNTISSNDIKSFIEDENNELWVATTNGLDRFNADRTKLVHYKHSKDDPNSISQNFTWRLFIDSEKNLWVTTDGAGINIYDKEKDNFKRYTHDKFNRDTLGTNKVRYMYEDKNKGIWIATVPSGIDYIGKGRQAINTWREKPLSRNSIVNDLILTIHEDDFEQIWIGTESGLSMYNPKKDEFTNYRHDPDNENTPRANAILSLESDKRGNIWLGTWSGGLSKLDPHTQKFTHFVTSPNKHSPNHISSNFIWSLLFDHEENLWIGTEGGFLDKLDPKTGKFQHYGQPIGEEGGLSSPFIRALYEDEMGTIWLGTDTGLNKLDQKNQTLSTYQHKEGDENTLLQNNVFNIFQDREQKFWVATDGGLSLFDRKTESFEHYTKKDGLPNDSVVAITEDAQGILWAATLDGLARFDHKNENFNIFTIENGLAGNTTNRPAIHYSENTNKLYIGSTKGVSIISPEKISDNLADYNIVFTNLKVNNVTVDSINSNSPLRKSINVASSIHLNYEHKMLSLSFSSLNFGHQKKIQYRYKLEGFDDHWIESHSGNTATYTNLPAGNYTLIVAATDAKGEWNEQTKSINIIVSPPWWSTNTAYACYFFMVLAFILTIYRMQRNRLRFEKEKVTHFQYIDKMKSQILANTSHELRTPLNGIIGLAESLSEEAKTRGDKSAESKLLTITTSGKRLANLVNDILDFSKLEEHALPTAITTVNLDVVVQQTFELTAPLTGKKNVQMKNKTQGVSVLADEQKLQQILLNLVSNAAKFTDNGSVTVKAIPVNDEIVIKVIDTGVGIPDDHLDKVFESFQQVSNYQTREHGGTGLGLSITKKLVELMGGEISIESQLGKGTTFSFNLPRANKDNTPLIDESEQALQPALLKADHQTLFDIYIHASAFTKDTLATLFDAINPEDNTLLIVDDDPVNRMVLEGILRKHKFNVIEASGGHEALEKLDDNTHIDMLVLDIMMPRMSGFEVCENIRKNPRYKHLPILFLSATSNQNELSKAFDVGGNDFVAKPISQDILLTKILTHLLLSEPDKYSLKGTSTDTNLKACLQAINKSLYNGSHKKTAMAIWIKQDNKQYFYAGTTQEPNRLESSEAFRDLINTLHDTKALAIQSADLRKIPEFKRYNSGHNIIYKNFTNNNLQFVLLCHRPRDEDNAKCVNEAIVARTGLILSERLGLNSQSALH